MRRAILLPLLVAGLGLGCTTPEEDSCNIKTAGIHVLYNVTEDANGAIAEAQFWVGDSPGGTVLNLGETCDDSITVNDVTLTKTSGDAVGLDIAEYDHADFYSADITAADSYEFILTREDEDPYKSTVGTDNAPVITSPTAGASISRAEAFDILWDGDTGQIHLLIEGECILDYPNNFGEEISDTGSHTVNAEGIDTFQSEADSTCNATIALTRDQAGTLAEELKGTIRGFGVGQVTFESTP